MWSDGMRGAHIDSSRGHTLIEVLIAVAVTAVTMLGLIALQIAMARDARASSYREQAALVADALAEAARPHSSSDAALAQWKTRAASLLPKGDASVSAAGTGLSYARATWAMQATLRGDTAGPDSGQVIDAPASCGDAVAPQGMQCIVVAFAQ
jgi:Tfp pilus assembly protein PilV